MAQAISSTNQVVSIKGKIHTNEPVNPLSIVRIEKEESRWDGREYKGYPCILIEIEDEGKQKWFYAKGDEATRDLDYTALDAMINVVGGATPTPPVLYDAVVDASGGGDYLLPSAAISGGACSVFVRGGVYNEVDDIALGDNCKIVGETSGAVIIFPAGKGIISTIAGTIKTAGTINVTNGSSTVLGTGTAFVLGDVGSYLNIGLDFFKVASFVSATEVTIQETYNGDTDTLNPYKLSPMVVGVTIQSLNLQGGGVGAELVKFDKVLYGTIKEVFTNGSSTNNILLANSGAIDIENVISRNAITGGLLISSSIGVKVSESSFNNNADNGLFISNSTGITVDHCFASNNDNNGVEVSGGSSIVVSDTQAWNNGQQGIELTLNTTDVVLEGCNFQNNNIGINNSCERAIISNCFVSLSLTGISCLRKTHLSNNFVEDITGVGIFLATANPDYCTVTGNSLKDCGQGITVQSDNNTITSNTLENCSLGVRLLGVDGNILSNNRLIGTGDLSINLTTTATSNVLSHNQATIKLTSALDTEVDGLIYNKLQTTDATPTTISTIPIPTDDTQYIYDVNVTAMATDEVDYGIWKRTLVVKRISGTTTISLFNVDVDSQTGLIPGSITASVSGADIDIQATGVANTINWVGGHKLLSLSPTL